eukprot:CAMPEP_0204355928 /NCGR_PEP_ID=MMETSP0469-20131031/34543_1 /ASSEMBLY_ACC=CAM_ASM_000384 /TAXON_ID=2969 /ORGANISM="Oxyrrhis marina" /LENGTH=210 /DNA_ID=CAMNT_0051343297 /DNA_START=29 /DNA_END=657 /DNA_ORIENTATION=+
MEGSLGVAAIHRCIQSGSWEGLLGDTEMAELTAAESGPASSTSDSIALLYATQILACILADELSRGKFAFKRCPELSRSHPQVDAAHRLLAALWKDNFDDFWEVMGTCEWDGSVKPLVDEVERVVRSRLTAAIAAAYESISVADVARLLGIPLPSVQALATAQGWVVGTDGWIEPVSACGAPVPEEALFLNDKVHELTHYVAFLEQHRWG